MAPPARQSAAAILARTSINTRSRATTVVTGTSSSTSSSSTSHHQNNNVANIMNNKDQILGAANQNAHPRAKRKADGSPVKQATVKRSAFGDVTNSFAKNNILGGVVGDGKNNNNNNHNSNNPKKAALGLRGPQGGADKKTAAGPVAKPIRPVTIRTVTKPKQTNQHQSGSHNNNNNNNENAVPPGAPQIGSVVTRATVKSVALATQGQTVVKAKDAVQPLKEHNNANNNNGVVANGNRVKTRLSNEFEKTDESSIYSTALEDNTRDDDDDDDHDDDTILSSGNNKQAKTTSTAVASSAACVKNNNSKQAQQQQENNEECMATTPITSVSMVAEKLATELSLNAYEVPEGVDDFDRENWDDVYQVSHYAMDIFNYMRGREPKFAISDYMDRQICLTTHMRALLVDWMVEVQESFELNHECLYLGVKLVDTYLSRMTVGKETLQLVGAAAIFIASKYDERMPPLVDDFLYVCDGAYTRRELIRMEINILKMCDFDLGIPISYRFLRRYARCAKITMPILTLARFILEYSLMDYATVMQRDSKLAAASLYLALRMRKVGGWTPALEFYSGYKLQELLPTVCLLNNGLHRKQKSQLMTIRNKYSHKIFFEVAKTPLIRNEDVLAAAAS